ncbi:hypothetical protein HMPREF9171_2010 [Streptococcus agalactiae ATCC 13813]|nr:hypothetical protein HMPREF9171_2010 [Streptococcus agalactiae ATCC 13813]
MKGLHKYHLEGFRFMKLSKQLYKSLPLLTVVLCVGALQQNVETKAKHYKTTSHVETQYVSTS